MPMKAPMKAILQTEYGPADQVLHYTDIDAPALADDEVLVRVRAAAMHPDIWHQITGQPFVMRIMGAGLLRPKLGVPGTDMAGVVEEVGAEVTDFAVGDAVFGEVVSDHQWKHGGCYAELCAVPAAHLAKKPERLSFEEAAVVPTTGKIAIRCLREEGQLRPGHHVLVNGAGGGVGTFAVQIAKAFGAEVTAVDRGDKLEMLRSIGADHVIDYTAEDVTESGLRFDLILDVASTLSLSEVGELLAPKGKYVIVGHDHFGRSLLGSLGTMIGLSARAAFDSRLPRIDLSASGDGGGLPKLCELIEAGQLTPVLDRSFPLNEVGEAIRYMMEGTAKGRVVIRVSEPDDPAPRG